MATIEKLPLPALDSARIKELGWTIESDRYTAYVKVLEAEAYISSLVDEAYGIKQAMERKPAIKEAEGRLAGVRVAGYLLLEFENQSNLFGITPSTELTKWLISPPQSTQSSQHDVIIDNGVILRDNFIRMFRTSNAQYPPSSHPSRPSFDTLEDMNKDMMESSGDNYSASRRKVLARDGYRCAVTGRHDIQSLNRCAELKSLGDVPVVPVEAAHILNESIMRNIDPAVDRESENVEAYNRTDHTAGALTILKLFGFSTLVDAFTKPGGVHKPWNLITLERNVHYIFDHLWMWFEDTNEQHCYIVCTSSTNIEKTIRDSFGGDDCRAKDAPILVEFNSKYEGVPPPDPFLLALHATCARVAHMSGAAEFIDQVEQDAEETRVLASDGRSCLLLTHLLSPFAAIPGVA